MALGQVSIEAAKGESCSGSTWLDGDEQDYRLALSVHFGEAGGVADGARAVLDASRAPTGPAMFEVQQIFLTNVTGDEPVILESHPEHDGLIVNGQVSWTSPSSGVYRLKFSELCWEDVTEPDWTVDCTKVADVYIELQCEPSEVDAGAVGVSSWVTSSEGDTLCVLP